MQCFVTSPSLGSAFAMNMSRKLLLVDFCRDSATQSEVSGAEVIAGASNVARSATDIFYRHFFHLS